MNYRHAFHAGNFADVLKHLVLIATLKTLHKKEKPLFVMDTHAGIGRYDLEADEATRSPEFKTGILPLWNAWQKGEIENIPELMTTYLTFIEDLNLKSFQKKGDLKFYTGSPLLVDALLRPQDRAILCEKHPADSLKLQNVLHGSVSPNNSRIHVYEEDGYEVLVASMPPEEKRGLILIDPPFEERDEFETLFNTVRKALRRWPTGIFVIWYPVKDEVADEFEEAIGFLSPKDRTDPFAHVYGLKLLNSDKGMTETRMLVIQPPYPSDQHILPCLPVIDKYLETESFFYTLPR